MTNGTLRRLANCLRGRGPTNRPLNPLSTSGSLGRRSIASGSRVCMTVRALVPQMADTLTSETDGVSARNCHNTC